MAALASLPETHTVIQLTALGLEEGNFAAKQVPLPEPSPSQLLVKVAFAGVNPVDMKLARGDFGDWTVGLTQGKEMSGTVVAVGSAVEAGAFEIGDEVMAYCDGAGWAMAPGSFAEFIAVHAHLATKKPAAISLEEAAAVPLAGLTAWECARIKVEPRPGDTVLVAGASGGVGTFLVQLLRASVGPMGRVLVTAGSDDSADYCKETLGCDSADILRYRGKTVEALVEEVKAMTGGAMCQCAYDLVGQDMKRLCFRCLAFDGRVASIVEEPPEGWAEDAADLWNGPKSVAFAKCLSVAFIWLGSRVVLGEEGKDSAVIAARLSGIAKEFMPGGAIAAPPIKVIGALSEGTVGEAVQLMAAGTAKGKFVIKCSATA